MIVVVFVALCIIFLVYLILSPEQVSRSIRTCRFRNATFRDIIKFSNELQDQQHMNFFQILAHPKHLLLRSQKVFGLTCFLLAAYMSVSQIVRFLENRDTSSISYKILNQSPQDKYPTYSVCLNGPNIFWKHEKLLFEGLGLLSEQYVQILKHNDGWRYKYDRSLRLYTKEPMSMDNISNLHMTKIQLRTEDVFEAANLISQDPDIQKNYKRSVNGTQIPTIPFHIGFQTADLVCLTRDSTDEVGSTRLHDIILLQPDLFNIGNQLDLKINILVHYPGQLVRAIDTPSFKSTLEVYRNRSLNPLDLKISHITTLRKRPTSNIPCNEISEDDDRKFQSQIINRIGCVPLYWNYIRFHHKGFRSCMSPKDVKRANHYIQNYRDVLSSYDPPCIEMKTLVTVTRDEVQFKQEGQIRVTFIDKTYQEIENVQDFSFETFWSSLGGFIGIFLGYSVLQIPELLVNVRVSVLEEIKTSGIMSNH